MPDSQRRNSTVVFLSPDKHTNQGAHLSPHQTFLSSVFLLPSVYPEWRCLLCMTSQHRHTVEAVCWRSCVPNSCWNSTLAQCFFEILTRTFNPVKKQHVTLSILLKVSPPNPNSLSRHAQCNQMKPRQYLTWPSVLYAAFFSYLQVYSTTTETKYSYFYIQIFQFYNSFILMCLCAKEENNYWSCNRSPTFKKHNISKGRPRWWLG